MRLAVLCAPQSWYLRDLQRAAKDRHEVVGVPFTQIAAELDSKSSAGISTNHNRKLSVDSAGMHLDGFDAVLVRTMPPGSLEQVVFRMDALARLEAAGCVVINPPKSIETCVDKFLASTLLVEAGLDHPRTFVCQTVDEAMQAFELLGGDVVLKPLFGAEGRGIDRIEREPIAHRIFKSLVQMGSVLYLQKFVPHFGYDCRAFVLGERVFGMKRVNAADWRTNVSRGATTQPLELTSEMIELARRATTATGAIMAGVDLLPGRDGRLYVIEVNAVPGWQALARTTNVDIAALVLEEIAGRVLRVDLPPVRGTV